MSDDFPKEFDLVVIGTGLTESIVAAAASRIGRTVLHLDRNDYYGGFFASFNLDALQSFALKERSPDTLPVFQSDDLQIFLNSCHIENVDLKWSDLEGETSPKDILLKNNRNYNIDLFPTLLYSLGGMVKLLISSNICRYVEFRSVDRVATLLNNEIRTVPCSRSDVFVTSEVNVVEKRIMMKLIETCMELKEGQEEFEAHRAKTFREFLVGKRAPAKVQHYIIQALSMSTEETSFAVGVASLNRFVESLGRYGNSPFLFPMYGCGEIPQCFCRLCAVFGGIYCLQRGIKSIKQSIEGDSKLTLQLETNEEISVKNVVFGAKTMRTSVVPDPDTHLVRGILIADQPLKDTNEKPKGGGVEFIRLTHEKSEAYLIQLSHYSGCCPKDVYLYHFITTADKGVKPRDALRPFVGQIFPDVEENREEGKTEENAKPKILFELFFTIPIVKSKYHVSSGIHSVGGPAFALDYDTYIEEAKEMFLKLYPEEEFLPRAPEPEEIIMDGYDDKDNAADDDAKPSAGDDNVETAPKEDE